MTISCAILCQSVLQSTTRALLFALLATGCGGTTATDGVTSFGGTLGASGTGGNAPIGGTSHTGEAAVTGGAAGVVGIGGAGAASVVGTGGAGGTGGAVPTTDCNAHGSPPDCGTCTMTLQEYCGPTSPCQLKAASICTQFAFGSTWKRGCGYVQQDSWGDVGDRFTSIWDEASGQLVYYWSNGMESLGCVPEKHVGTQPTCDTWTDACGAMGGSGGTTGFGGSVGQTGGATPTGGTRSGGVGGSAINTGGAHPIGGSPGIWMCDCNCVCASCTGSSTGRCSGPSSCDTCTPTCTQYCATTTGCGAFVSESEQICGLLQ
jgi:hypothetical protein